MKKYGFYLILMLVTLCAGTSCNDDNEDDPLGDWMVANQEAFNAIKTNPEYKELKSPGNEGSIYYKVLEKGDGTDTVKYTSTVTCFYKGWLVAEYPELNIENGTIFDQRLFDDGPAASFRLRPEGTTSPGVIGGWKTALQHMVKGDKWEIWIPYQLGYGREGLNSIPGYSTLAFEMEVVTVDGK